MGATYSTPTKPSTAKKGCPPATRLQKKAAGQFLQTKLEVGPSGDRFEQEADRVADQVMRQPGPARVPPMISGLNAQPTPAKKESKASRAQRETVKADEELIDTSPAQRKANPVQRISEVPGDIEDEAGEKVQRKTRSESIQREVVKGKSQLEDLSPPIDEKETSPAQRKETGSDDGFTVSGPVESQINRAKASGGEPIPEAIREKMEGRFGRDFSNVRFHSNQAASEAAQALQARAFTLKEKVFFDRGALQPQTTEGQNLIAHELTHTVQQEGGSSTAQASRIQRDKKGKKSKKEKKSKKGVESEVVANTKEDEAKEDDPRVFDGKKLGKIIAKPGEDKDGTLELPFLDLPTLRGQPKGFYGEPAPGKNPIQGRGEYVFLGSTPRSSTTARHTWLKEAEKNYSGSLKAAIPDKVKNFTKAGKDDKEGNNASIKNSNKENIYFLRLTKGARSSSSAKFILIGTVEELSKNENILMPVWNKSGDGDFFDVDHDHELQLGGLDGWENFWLLDQSANRSAGSKINNHFKKRVKTLFEAAEKDGFWTEERAGRKTAPDFKKGVKANWKVVFAQINNIKISKYRPFWLREELKKGDHLGKLHAMDNKQLLKEGLKLSDKKGFKPSFVSIFTQKEGGFRRRVKPPKDSKEKGYKWNKFYSGFNLKTLEYEIFDDVKEGRPIGKLWGIPFRKADGKGKKKKGDPIYHPDGPKNIPIPILQSENLGYGGYVDQTPLRKALDGISIEGASPIQIKEAGIDINGNVFANGEIIATKALFPNLHIPIRLVGNDIFISFPIPTDNLSFGPVDITEASLDIGFGENGFFFTGFIDVAVDQIGTGRIEARMEKEGPRFEGDFNFETDFLNPASAEFIYDYPNDALTLTLNAGVEKGKVPGIQSGHIIATMSREGVSFSGTLTPVAPLQDASLTVGYSKESGLNMAADNIPLPVSKIPGVKDATLSIWAKRNPKTREWKFGGSGKGNFGVPAVNGDLNVTVDGQIIVIKGTGNFAKGPAAGSMKFTATNQGIDEEGNPIEGKVDEQFRVWGGGTAAMNFGKVLKGTAGIEFTKDAEVIITGEIALPPKHKVFKKWSDDKKLVHVKPPEFPIWGVSVAGVGIGIFAFVDAKLGFNAFVGPGTLEDTKVNVTLDLDRPEDAVVTGNARFVVPAGAAFVLDIGGGLRARIAVAQVSGRVGMDATLGLEAKAEAAAKLHWTRQQGLSLAATVEANAHPKFDLGINASVTASVDLYFTEPSKTWGPWRKQLGSFGPEMEVGVGMPIAWSEQKGLDFDLNKIDIKKPEVNYEAFMKDSFLELV